MALNWNDGSPEETADTEPAFCVLYAGAKTGKTTLASEFPSPLYVRTGKGERAPAGVTMKSFGVSESYQDILDQADWMLQTEHDRKTFVLDSADGLEQKIHDKVCEEAKVASIEDIPYGKGYAKALETWHDFVGKMLELKEAGFYVVVICHVKAKTVPGVTTDSYPRYMPNLRDDAVGVLIDAADLIGFLHQAVSIKKEDAGFNKQKTRGVGGGEILIAVQERPGFIAGNRYGIEKGTLPFKRGEGFKALDFYFQRNAVVADNDNDDEADAA
jgi:hypothetical protein